MGGGEGGGNGGLSGGGETGFWLEVFLRGRRILDGTEEFRRTGPEEDGGEPDQGGGGEAEEGDGGPDQDVGGEVVGVG